MATRRMFSKEITTSDAFVDMPLSTQLLYFHLGMEADDEGFLGNAKMLSRAYGTNHDDLKLLEAKGFVIAFPNGVTVIKDWEVNNKIRKDRRKPTIYIEEKKLLNVDSKGSYQLENNLSTKCQPNDNQMSAQVRLGKDRLGKDSKDILSSSDEQDRIPFNEIVDYLNLKANKKFRATSADTKKLIKARWNEGYKLDDFKRVIDNKCFSWERDSEMSKYLRPKTLFGTKFESYLNENQIEKANIGYTRTDDDYAGTPFG